MLMRESPHKPAPPLYLALDIVSCSLSLFGEPCPSLYKLEGRVTCGVLVGLGLGLVYLFLQVEYKSGSCFLPLKPAYHNVSRPSGP